MKTCVFAHRALLAASVAGVLASASVWAQDKPASVDTTPAIPGVVQAGTKIELIKDGFTGTEGPVTLAADIERPNGIQLSPDDKMLYVANTLGEYVLAYDVAADGSVGPRRNFAKLDGWKKTETGGSSGADGLAVDDEGRLYVAFNIGIQVFSNKGDALGTIALAKQPQNLAFAGEDKKTLYVVGRGSAYRIAVLTPGVGARAK